MADPASYVVAGPCVQVAGHGSHGDCSRPGRGVVVLTTRDGQDLAALGRRVSGGPYCVAHGGTDRARSEAVASWQFLAPACVGDVAAAGGMGLDSRAAYVVVRREEDEPVPELWSIRCGRAEVDAVRLALGIPASTSHRDSRITAVAPGIVHFPSLTDALRRQRGLSALGVHVEVTHHPACTRPRQRPWLALLGIGSFGAHVGAAVTSIAAEAIGRAAWRHHVDTAVASIRAARGGTLDWGMEFEVADEPTVLRPRPGQTGWDLVAAERRQAKAPLCAAREDP